MPENPERRPQPRDPGAGDADSTPPSSPPTQPGGPGRDDLDTWAPEDSSSASATAKFSDSGSSMPSPSSPGATPPPPDRAGAPRSSPGTSADATVLDSPTAGGGGAEATLQAPSLNEEIKGAPGDSATPAPGDETLLAASDDAPISGIGERPVTARRGEDNEAYGATIRRTGPQWTPAPKYPRWAIITSAALVIAPLALWLAAGWTARGGGEGAPWEVAAVLAPAGAVAPRPAGAKEAAGGAALLARRDQRLIARAAGGAETPLWTFPEEASASLAGTSLDDAVLWIARSGPFASRGAGEGIALVLWRPGQGENEAPQLSLLSAGGKALWSATLERGARMSQISWVPATGEGEKESARLLYQPPGEAPQFLDAATGRRVAAKP